MPAFGALIAVMMLWAGASAASAQPAAHESSPAPDSSAVPDSSPLPDSSAMPDSLAMPDSSAWVGLPVPQSGLVYVRYGKPGGVHLTRGSGPRSGRWRDRVRLILGEPDGTDAATDSVRTGGLLHVLQTYAVDGEDAGRSLASETPSAAPIPAVAGRREEASVPLGTGQTAREAAGEAARQTGETPTKEATKESPEQTTKLVPMPVPSPAPAPPPDTVWVPVPLPATETVAQTPQQVSAALMARKVVHTQAILFETDRATLLPGSQPILQALTEFMIGDTLAVLTIEGHADARGSDEYNQALSERRAQSVRGALVARGVSGDRLTAVGFGESRPLDPRHSLEAYAFNRRVSFRVAERGQ